MPRMSRYKQPSAFWLRHLVTAARRHFSGKAHRASDSGAEVLEPRLSLKGTSGTGVGAHAEKR